MQVAAVRPMTQSAGAAAEQGGLLDEAAKHQEQLVHLSMVASAAISQAPQTEQWTHL